MKDNIYQYSISFIGTENEKSESKLALKIIVQVINIDLGEERPPKHGFHLKMLFF
jgi:hypothetical protein